MAILNVQTPSTPPLLRIEPFKGINLSSAPTQIDQSQASSLLNMNIDERGALNKRTGYERVFATSLGAGAMNGLYEYRKVDGTTKFLIAHGTKLYTQSGSAQPVEIYAGLADARVNFFTMNDLCYIQDGTHYLVYDGSTVSAVTPYIPTLAISKSPDGGGTAYEDFNLLGAGFKDSFSGDGTATAYQLSLTNLDATAVTATVDGVAKAETTDFTVNRTTGVVTFTTAPATGTNNIIITAYKTQASFPDRVKKCTISTIFGGANDTRVFITGNPIFPDYIWRSGLDDPTYWPEEGFYKFHDQVMGFAKQYDYLVIERANGKHLVSFSLDDTTGAVSFPSKPIHDQVGTIASGSIQLVENNPVSLSKDGVYMLTASSVRDERNVSHISTNIDTKLLSEPNLQNAISVDFNKKYWLALNGNVYVYDYAIAEWYLYDNIQAHVFLERNGYLYFGSSAEGLVYRFKKEDELFPYNDDGAAIQAKWVSKVFSFGADERRKLVDKVYFSLKPAIHTSADLYYLSDKKMRKFIKTTRKDLFDYNYVDYGFYTYGSLDYPQEASNKIKAKKIVYFQLEIVNDKLDEPLGLLSLGIKYAYQSFVK